MISRLGRILVSAFLFCLLSAQVSASPMSPELLERLKRENRLESVVKRLQQARLDGYFHVDQSVRAKPLARMAGDIDTIRVPVILVDFSDRPYDIFPTAPEAAEFDSVLFSWDKMPKGSMTEWYWENSYGKFYLTGDVVGWYRMPQTYDYYCNSQNGFGSYPRSASRMVEDAIIAAQFDLNYADYDNDGDNWVDGIFVVFAGYGAEETGSDNDIWSHRSSAGPIYVDGVYVSSYSVEPEVRYPGVITDIGVFCHEFGHVLGLPDLYDTDYTSSGIGRWSMMAGGSWNDNGHTPAHFDAWCKKELGFIEPVNITINTDNVEIPRAEDAPVAYRLWTEGQLGQQYFLIENRQQVLSDAALPGAGLLIWHIDETRSNNRNEAHPLVGLEQADGLFQLEAGGGSDPGDPWPGSTNNREFNDFTTPNSHDYDNALTEIGVLDISDLDSLMTATLEIVYGRPFLVLENYEFNDAGGNGDGRADPGESNVGLVVTVHNLAADALGLTMQVSTADPEIVFTDDLANYGDVLHGVQATNYADPIVFDVDAEFPPTIVDFVLSYSANGGEHTFVETLTVHVGPPQIVLIDDDEANPGDYEKYFYRIFDSLRTPYVVWGKDTLSSPPPDTLKEYPLVIWFTGDHRSEVLSSADVTALEDLLDAGGRLFLTGQDIAADLANDADSAFLRDYLHVRFGGNGPYAIMLGVPGDPIGDGHMIQSGSGGVANQNSPDILVPASGLAQPVYNYYNTNDAAGVRVANGDYRAVFFGFGFEGVGNDLGTTREEIYERVFAWLFDDSPPYTPGDLNSDDEVNPIDVVLMVNYVYKAGDLPVVPNSGDINADCEINPVDAVLLVNFVYKNQGELLPGCFE